MKPSRYVIRAPIGPPPIDSAYRVFFACIGYGERLVAAKTQAEALKLLGLKRADIERTRFREVDQREDRRGFLSAVSEPGQVFRRRVTSGDLWSALKL